MPRRSSRGYVLAEALVSAALAAMTSALAIVLLIWAAAAIDRAQSTIGAVRLLERLYEQSRLSPPAQLASPAYGVVGRYAWSRVPGASLDTQLAYAPVPVRITVRWTASGQPEERQIDAVVPPGGAPHS